MNLVTCLVGDKYTEEMNEALQPDFTYRGGLLDVPGVWNKLMLFKAVKHLSGPCLFVDLDSTFRGDVELPAPAADKLTVVSSYWKRDDPKYYEPERLDTVYNSSVLYWNAGECEYISDYFMRDPEYYYTKYKGIDRFLMWEDIEVETFEDGIMSSNAFPFIGWSPIITYNGEDFGPYFESLKQAGLHRRSARCYQSCE